jgi:A/G-specific adenine glycosylase
MVARFDGRVPESYEELRSLKGIGAYTAAAISSIAYGHAHVALDGNLERVLSRVLGTRADPKREGRPALEALGHELVSLGRPGDVNQALMDLSAALCLPKEPRCLACPVTEHCEARRLGIQREIPFKKPKTAPVDLTAEGLVLLAEESLLLARRAPGSWLAGMWDIPWWLPDREKSPRWDKAGAQFARCAQKRTITKHRIDFQVRAVECEAKPDPRKLGLPGSEFRWVPLADLHGVNLPRPSERALEDLLQKR